MIDFMIGFDYDKNDSIFLRDVFMRFSKLIVEWDLICFYDLIVNLLIQSLVGEFSLIYIDSVNCKIVVSKDIVGRRSLLLGLTVEGLIISSVSCKSI